MSKTFAMVEQITNNPSNDQFFFHIHEWYEILWFLEGDARYIVEGNTFSLKQGDVIIIRKNQMHRIFLNSSKRYRRFIFTVHPTFFKLCNCTEYETDFFETKNNKIDSEIVRTSGLQDAFLRAKKYSDNFEDAKSPVVRSIMIEILYLINKVTSFSEGKAINKQLIEVMDYISQNYTQSITLDELEKRFYVSKYHLSHVFTRATGLTLYQYITKKRLFYAKELIAEGRHTGEAASLSGFNTYSSFYRAYINEYGVPPSQNRNISNIDGNI